MSRSSRRGPWLPEEDNMLMDLVRTQGPNNWVRISQQLKHRSPKQCRERFHQNLKPSLNHEPISAQEGEIIEQLVREMGKRWAEIARRLGNRSDNAVKNWWNGSMNRRKRNPAHLNPKQIGNRLQPISLTQPHKPLYHDYTSMASFSNAETRRVDGPIPPRWRFSYEPSSTTTMTTTMEIHRSELLVSRPSDVDHRNGETFPSRNTDLSSFKTNPVPAHSGGICTEKVRLPTLRLPPPAALSTVSGWHSPLQRSLERPLISPALSEISQVTSARQAPSLISDSQSTYSISPKTVPSPRAHSAPLLEGTSLSWDDAALREKTASIPAFPPANEFSRGPVFQQERGPLFGGIQTHESDKAGFRRDIRMHVANLVQ